MRRLYGSVLALFLSIGAAAEVHYARLEPYQTYVIKAAAAGQVTAARDDREGHIGDGSVIVQIDDRVDRAQIRALETTLKALKQTLELTEAMAKNQQKVYEKEKRYYERTKDLKTKSRTEKDRIFAAMMAADNQLLSLKEKIATLGRQIGDTEYQIFMLKDRIAKKAVRAEGLYIYKVAVRRGDYVNPGALLLTAMDTRKGRLVVYLDSDEVKDIENKRIYINGKASDLRFEKLIRVADETHISSYRGEIVVPDPGKLFSKLIKIEVK